MLLRFVPAAPHSTGLTRRGFAALASAWVGRPVEWQCVERRALEDPNPGGSGAFLARWADGEATLEERVEGSTGNPRDGYGYDVRYQLTVGQRQAHLSSGGWEPLASDFRVEFSRITVDALLEARAALRSCFGEAADLSHEACIARENVRGIDPVDAPGEAVALVQEALAQAVPADYGQPELSEWLGRHQGGAEGLRRRLRDLPAGLPGWLEAVEKPPAGYGPDRLTQTLARLCPFEGAHWLAAGRAPAPWFRHPQWSRGGAQAGAEGEWHRVHLDAAVISGPLVEKLSAQLTGWDGWKDWQDHTGEFEAPNEAGWTWRVRRHARYRAPHDAYPVVRVTMTSAWRPTWKLPTAELLGRAPEETVEWNWLPGEDGADLLLVVTRTTPEGTALTWARTGGADFGARVDAALKAVTPFAWHPCSAAESLSPWVPPAPAPWLSTASVKELALAALTAAAVSAPLAERARSLLAACHCAQPLGYCAHRQELLTAHRELRGLHAVDSREASRVDAQAAALGATFEAAGANPDEQAVRRSAERVAEALTLLQAMGSPRGG